MAGAPPVRRAVRLYRAGRTTREVGTALGADESTVRRWLAATGEPRRPRGTRRRADVPDAAVVELRDGGATWAEVAEEVGMSISGVRRRYLAATRPGFTRWA